MQIISGGPSNIVVNGGPSTALRQRCDVSMHG